MTETGLLSPGIKEISWDDWRLHPDWLTEKQLREQKLMAWGNPVAAVWYTSRRIYPEGHWLFLYDKTLARPKEISEKRRSAIEKAKETARKNRTCVWCKRDTGRKIELQSKLCYLCHDLAREIQTARNWLAAPNALILETATTGLTPGQHEVIQIAVLDIRGTVLLDTFIKPVNRILEISGRVEKRYSHTYDEYCEYECYIPSAFEVNGITNEMLKTAPTFPEIWPELQRITTGMQMLVFNADFDRAMLDGDRSRHHLPGLTPAGWTDLMRWYAQHYGDYDECRREYTWQSLDFAANHEQVEVDNSASISLAKCLRSLGIIQAVAIKQKPEGVQ